MELSLEFIELGFQAKVIATRADLMGEEWLGRTVDKKFLKDVAGLNKGITPCGEAGEFHTLVIDGPVFKKSMEIRDAATVEKRRTLVLGYKKDRTGGKNSQRLLLKKVILLLGGARSGKSHFAQEYARRNGEKVLFVATATAGDEDMRQRIEKHQKDRPSNWRTLEAATDIGMQIEANAGDAQLIVIDCITMLVSNIFSRYDEQQFDTIDDHDAGERGYCGN